MPLTGMQIALAMTMAETTNDDGNNMVGDLVMAMRDQIRLALLTPPNKQQHSRLPTLLQQQVLQVQRHPKQRLASLLFLFSLFQLHHHLCCGGLLLPKADAVAAIRNAKTKVAPAASQEQPPTSGSLSSDDDQEEDEEQQQQEEGHADTLQAEEEATGRDYDGKANNRQQPCQQRQQRLVAAAKCGFSLGLAVLLGLLFSNDHGFWSGLIVATTISTGRESTWVVAIARAHGTALGSVCGALGGLLISQQQQQQSLLVLAMDLRFLLVILPWMVVATFLKRSRAYGPAGGVAAALSVVIIVGRRYDEAPMAFTMTRLVETFIGISCSVLADLVFQPGARPSVQAREQLTRCIAALADSFAAPLDDADPLPPSSQLMKLKSVQQQLAGLTKHAAEAVSEPTYLWLPPFPAACYGKIQSSLGRMVQLLQLYYQASLQADLDNQDMMIIHRRRFSSLLSTSLGHCLRMLHKGGQQLVDLEAGIDAGSGSCCCSWCCKQGQEATALEQLVVGSFQDHQAAALLDNDDMDSQEDDTAARGLQLCCLGSIALCMGEIVKEAQRLEAHTLDLNKLQPSC